MKSKLKGIIIALLILAMTMTGFTSPFILKAEDLTVPQDNTISLKFLVIGQGNYKTYEKLALVQAYRNAAPNVNLIVDCMDTCTNIKDQFSKYDIILLPGDKQILSNCAQLLEPLDGLDAVLNNLYADNFKIGGKVLAIPSSMGTELVYYRKSIFKSYNLKVPQTWPAFISTLKIIRDKNKYIPVSLGGKDLNNLNELTQTLLYLETGNKTLWESLDNQTNPFIIDKPAYKALYKFKSLYDKHAFGSSSLTLSANDALNLFKQKKAVMILGRESVKTELQYDTDVGCFFLPLRGASTDKLNVVQHVSGFMVISNSSENKSAAKDFVNWHFGKLWYQKYIDAGNKLPSQKEMKSGFKAKIIEAFNNAGSTANFINIADKYSAFDNLYKISGVNLKQAGINILQGKSFDILMKNANLKWEATRKLFFGGKFDLSQIYYAYSGTAERVIQYTKKLNSPNDAVLITNVTPAGNQSNGLNTNIKLEVEYNLVSQDKARLTVGFNNGDTPDEVHNSIALTVLKGYGKFIITMPVTLKPWTIDQPFFAASQLADTANNTLCEYSKANLLEIFDLSTAFTVPILRGTVEKLCVPVTNVDPAINSVKITKVTPNTNLKAGTETNITIEVEYNLVSQDSAILSITFNNSENEPNADMERALWKVSKGKGKYIFTVPVTPKIWNNGTPFRVGTQLHNFSDPDPIKHNASLSDSNKVNLGVIR